MQCAHSAVGSAHVTKVAAFSATMWSTTPTTPMSVVFAQMAYGLETSILTTPRVVRREALAELSVASFTNSSSSEYVLLSKSQSMCMTRWSTSPGSLPGVNGFTKCRISSSPPSVFAGMSETRAMRALASTPSILTDFTNSEAHHMLFCSNSRVASS